MKTIACLPGDGIGPEVLAAARSVLDAVGFEAEYVEAPVGWSEWCRHGNALPDATLDLCRRADAIWFGAITSQADAEAEAELAPSLRGRGLRYESPIVRLRRELDLFANVRPCTSFEGHPGNLRDGVDLVIVRENTEGLYSGVEFHPVPGDVRRAFAAHSKGWARFANEDVAVTARVVSRRGVERVARHAFRMAEARRRHVTLVEKANVLRATGGLVVDVVREVAREFPTVDLEVQAVDSAAMDLVRRPDRFDVVLATNLFGDVLSDVAAAVTGGLGLAASANVGSERALFEPVHGSAPDLRAGVANPLAAILSGAMMLDWLGERESAAAVRDAVARTIREGPRTRDMNGSASTVEVARAVARHAVSATRRVAV